MLRAMPAPVPWSPEMASKANSTTCSPPHPPAAAPWPPSLPQVIKILKSAFERCGLDLYLAPYGCLPTGYEKGVIEVVPHTKSRAALGELSDRGLYDIFLTEFGAPGSPQFERARRNFIVSEAGYAIASYLLQVGVWRWTLCSAWCCCHLPTAGGCVCWRWLRGAGRGQCCSAPYLLKVHDAGCCVIASAAARPLLQGGVMLLG
jgi:hypothetical protein